MTQDPRIWVGRLVWELSENVWTVTTKIIGKNNLLVGSWGRKCPDAPTNLLNIFGGPDDTGSEAIFVLDLRAISGLPEAIFRRCPPLGFYVASTRETLLLTY